MSAMQALTGVLDGTPFAAELPPLTICDVGANPIGRPIYDSLLEAGLAEVWGFEPHPDAFAKLESGAGRHWIQAAVGAPGAATFHAYPASEMSSLYALSEAALDFIGHFKRHLGTETRQPVTLQALDDIAALPPVDCLKIDAQGAELQVISHGEAKLAHAVCVIAEMRFYGLYEGEPALGALDLELRRQGFVLHKFLHQKARMIGHSQRKRVDVRAIGSQAIDGDAVYIRCLENPARWSDAQLAYMVMIAATMIDSHDLALHCLDRLAGRDALPESAPQRYAEALPARYLA
jgi:FkbM family methyltransferase